MALVTINGVGVLGGTVWMPLIGAWTADLTIDQPNGEGFDAGTEVTITAEDGFELKGVVAPDRTGDFLDTVHVRVIGGAGGMANPATIKSYVQPSAFAKDVIKGLTDDSGETLSSTADQAFLGTNLTAWAVMNGIVSQALEMLIFMVSPQKHWRILANGELWIGDETWTETTVSFELINQDPTDRTFILGVVSPSIVPGVAVQGIGRISRAEHFITSNAIRTKVWTHIEEEQRGIVASIQALVRQEMSGIDYQALYKFKIVSQSADLLTVDVNPVAPNDARLPGLTNVPVRAGSAVKVQFAQNATVLVGWDGGDPRSPFVCLGASADSVQRIRIAGNTDAARKGDHSDSGSLVFAFGAGSGAATLAITYTDPDGTITSLPAGSGSVPLKAKLTEGSTLVGVG